VALPAVGLADEDAEQDGIVGDFHGQAPFQ
jgi:hypothetical protein